MMYKFKSIVKATYAKPYSLEDPKTLIFESEDELLAQVAARVLSNSTFTEEGTDNKFFCEDVIFYQTFEGTPLDEPIVFRNGMGIKSRKEK